MRRVATIILICSMIVNLFSFELDACAESLPYVVNAYVLHENFEAYEDNAKPDMVVYESQGSVLVESIDENKFLSLKTSEGQTLTNAEKSLGTLEDKVLTISFRFRQNIAQSNDNLICGLYSDSKEIVGVYTRDGKIYCNEETNIMLASYEVDQWVNVSFKVDLIADKVNCNGNSYGITPDAAINKYKLGIKYAPGFSIDDIEIITEHEIKDLAISGNSIITLPDRDEKSYTYSASGLDTYDTKVELTDVEWSLLDSSENTLNSSDISLSVSEDNNAIITVKPAATIGKIKLKAQAAGGLSKILDINVASLIEQNSYIEGFRRIAGDNKGEHIYSYELKLFDQNGDLVANYGDCEWSLEGLYGFEVPSYITIDANGNITVSGETPHREFINVVASSSRGNFQIKKKVLVTDFASYVTDTYRYEAVKNHVDTVLKDAGDIYHGTPLISDLLNVYDDEPGRIILQNGEIISTSNFESQSSLLKTMWCLSEFENTDYYRDVSVDYAEHMVDNYRDTKYGQSLLSGGHLAIDMELQGVNPASSPDRFIHESKGINPYWEPLFSADPEFAADYMKGLVLGHLKYDKDPRLAADRHWYIQDHAIDLGLWYNRDSYSSKPGVPIYDNDACTFVSAYSDMFNQLAAFYSHVTSDEDTGNDGEREEILGWIDIIYDCIDNVGYDPITGEYTGMCYFTTTRNRNPFESTYENQTNVDQCAKWNLNQGTPDEIQWYDRPDYDEAQVAQGDRLYLNVIDGVQTGDSWLISHKAELAELQKQLDQNYGVGKYSVEQFFIEPYYMGGGPANFTLSTALSECFDAFDLNPDDSEAQALKLKISKKYVHSVCNSVNLLYDFDKNCWRKKMTFGLDISDWSYPHNGYYGDEGKKVGTKKLDADVLFYLCKTIALGYDILQSIPEEEYYDDHLKKNMSRNNFENMLDQLMDVAKDVAYDKYFIGDIGNPFKGEAAELDYSTPSTDVTLILSLINLYMISENSDYLDLACVVANNIVNAQYNEKEKVFMDENSVMTKVSNKNTHILLALEAVLLDDYDKYIVIAPDSLSSDAYMELYITTGNTNISFIDPPYKHYTVSIDNEAKPLEIEIEPSFTLFVGDRKQISYKILPFDASQNVFWDSTNRKVATVSDTGEIVAVGKGKTKVRCVSKSSPNIVSKEITVTVR